jgi:hypothetical protein
MSTSQHRSIRDLERLDVLVMQVPRGWMVAVGVAAVASAIHVEVDAGHHVSGSLAPGTLTAVVLALIWLPSLVRVLGLSGGRVKTPAGEATTPGLAGLFEDLPAEEKLERLPGFLSSLEAPQIVAKEDPVAEELRRDLQRELAAVAPRPPGDGPRERLDYYAKRYEEARRDMDPGRERTLRMTSVTAEARAVARSVPPSLVDLRHMLDAGTDGERVVALSVVQDRPDTALFDDVVAIAIDPRSPFEQYQALGALMTMERSLNGGDRRHLRAALEQIRERGVLGVNEDLSRARLVDYLLRRAR